jgi:hypothetical protein
MTEQLPPFFLIIADQEQEFFCVEGPMTDDRPWQNGARDARNKGRKITCGPAGPESNALATEYHRVHKLAGAPPGSILRLRQ